MIGILPILDSAPQIRNNIAQNNATLDPEWPMGAAILGQLLALRLRIHAMS